jgi:hypothetical protein
VRDSVELERLGIPTVTLVTSSFERLARVTSEGLGMPDQALAVIPHPMGGIAADKVRSKVRHAFPEVERQLTAWRPSRTRLAPRPAQRYVRLTGSLSEVQAEFQARGWSAGLPFVPPTRDVVQSLLSGTSHSPDEVVWDGVPPRMGILTVELLAACAAMAGCKPEHLPVLLAIVEALQDRAAWYAHQATTTGTESLLFLVNGPIADELGLASGTGAAGLWYQPNAAVGYAMGLVSKVVGGSRPPDQDKSTLASPADLLNWTLAENEADNPWTSFAVEHGCAGSENVVTVKVVYPPIDIGDHQSETGEDLLRYISRCVNQPYVYAMRHQPVLLGLCPEHAATLAGDGWTKDAIRTYVWDHARYPANVYAKPAWDAGSIAPNADFPDLHYGSETLLPIVARPEDVQIIVCGGAGKHSHFWPGPKGMVTRKIDPWR